MSDIIEQVKDASTPKEMRSEIFRLSYYDPLVRSVRDAANYSGMSAEDHYTVLAYNALRERNKLQSLMLNDANISVRPMMIPK